MTARPPPYRITPAARPGALVFASPHSGRIYPGDIGVRHDLGAASLASAEDALVDQLVDDGPAHGAPLLAATIGRAYVDLNRDPADLDPALIDDCPATTPSPRTAAGYGVAPRLAGDGAALYDRRLSRAEVEARLAWAHAPYHAALTRLMQAARDQGGAAVLVDWHSMPDPAPPGRRGPDVVLGDRHGSACAPALTRFLNDAFQALGWRTALNAPYAGGYSTRRWGRPADGFHAIQIELNRSLYLDAASRTAGDGYDRCRAGVRRVIAALAARDWSTL